MLQTKSKLWKTWKYNIRGKFRYYSFAKTCHISITKYYASLEFNQLWSRNTGRFHRHISGKLQSHVNILVIAQPCGTLTGDPSEIDYIFNLYFSSVFTIEDIKNPITSNPSRNERNQVYSRYCKNDPAWP